MKPAHDRPKSGEIARESGQKNEENMRNGRWTKKRNTENMHEKMDNKIVEKNALWRTREISKMSDPNEKRKVEKNAPKKRFSGPGSAFFSDSSCFPHPSGRSLVQFRQIWADFGPSFCFGLSLCTISCFNTFTFSSTYGISYNTFYSLDIVLVSYYILYIVDSRQGLYIYTMHVILDMV